MNQAIKHVLLLEDQPIMRAFLVQSITAAYPGVITQEAATVTQAKELSGQYLFDLALLDISLPDGSGIEMITLLKRTQKGCQLIMCTIFDDDEHLFACLQAGAQGYLLKEHSQTELIEQLQQSLRGLPPLSPSIAHRILEHFQKNPVIEKDYKQEEIYHLTNREQEVLTLIAKGLTRNETAKILGISAYTVAEYIKNVYRKLNVSSRAEATMEALRLGLIKP